MSRICVLTGQRKQRRNIVTMERSRITRRTTRFAEVNLQRKTFVTQEFATLRLRIAQKTLRSIEQHESFEHYLANTKRGKLTAYGRQLRRKVYEKYNIPSEIKRSTHLNYRKRLAEKRLAVANTVNKA